MNYEYARLTEKELCELGVVLGAYRSFRGDRRAHIAYVGMQITRGKRYYEVLSNCGVRTPEELDKKYGKHAFLEMVIKPNIQEGIAFADRLGKERSLLYVAPSIFDATPWK